MRLEGEQDSGLKMGTDVFLIGTSHIFQARTRRTTASVQEAFKRLVLNAAVRHRVLLIAEETSNEANAQNGVLSTICDEVAQELFGTGACYVDPNNAERLVLGIQDVGSIRTAMLKEAHHRAPRGASFGHIVTDADRLTMADPRVRLSDEKREREWIRRLREHNQFPVLLICGANHVPGVCALAAGDRLVVEIVAKDWAPATL